MIHFKLADPHNFGQRVQLEGQRFKKPRPIFWEFQILGQSSFRSVLRQHGLESFLPTLNFEIKFDFSGTAQGLDLNPKPVLSPADLFEVGQAVALYSWLGSTDHHSENVVCGTDLDGRFRVASVDVENVLFDLEVPGGTGLLPTMHIPFKYCGLFGILSVDGNRGAEAAAKACEGYFKSLQILIDNEAELWRTLLADPGAAFVPIRAIIRKTQSYYEKMSGVPPSPGEKVFLACELEQVERGDVPYFFRTACSDRIFYYAEPEKTVDVSDQIQAAGIKLERPRLLVKGQIEPRQRGLELMKNGLVQIARSFFRDRVESHCSGAVRVVFSSEQIEIYTPKFNLACKKPIFR